jgi:glycosyltransferase involved in cell wall biosynthesis
MKVLRVIATIDPNTGGPLEGLKQASAIMSAQGITIEVLTLDEPSSFQSAADALAWPVHREGSEKRSYYGYSRRFRKWIEQHAADYDAIIIHGNWQYTGIATSRACRKAGVPYFVYPHGMLDPWFNQAYPLKKIKKQLYWWLAEHSVLHNANAVLFTSEEECRLARQSFRPYRVKENILGYGTTAPEIDPTQAAQQLRTSEHLWAQAPYFLFLGRIQEKKGLDLLIAAYSQLKAQNAALPELVIAGPEQQASYVAHLKNDFPQAGIHWIGAITGSLKWQALAAAEALCLTSHQENFGIVVAEALALGSPVLISDKVNIWREIVHDGAGFAASDTEEGARQLLQKWQALSTTDKARMGAQAQATFAQHFELHNATQRLIQLLKASTTRH